MLSRRKFKSAKKRSRDEQELSSNSTSTSKTQRTLQLVVPSDTIVRFSLGEKNVNARSVLLSKLNDEGTTHIATMQLSAAKLMRALRQKYPAFTEEDYHVYDRTYKEENR